MNNNLKLQDTFTVINRTILHNSDRNNLTILYQPIVGAMAINLYFTFWSHLDQASLMTDVSNFKQLINSMGLSLSEIEEARKYLEAVGLVKTFIKEGSDINDYRIELYSPLPPSEFFRNPLLCSALYSALGNIDYSKAKERFKIPAVKTEGYKDISSSFQSKFSVLNNIGIDTENIRKKNYNRFKVASPYDIDKLLSSTPEIVSNNINVSENVKTLLANLTFLYRYREDTCRELIVKSIKGREIIDEKMLSNNFAAYYKFESNNLLPTIQKKIQPTNLREDINPKDKDARIIYLFETCDNISYLCSKLKVKRLPDNHIDMLNTLAVHIGLNPGVINVLLSYILSDPKKNLNKNFATTIGAEWKRRNIETVKQAMDYVRGESQNRKDMKVIKQVQIINNKKHEEAPKWFDKEIEIQQDLDKSNEIQELINSL